MSEKGAFLMKKVELVNVGKSYDQKTNVIQDINVTIEPGEFFVLVGPVRMREKYNAANDCRIRRSHAGEELLIGDVKTNKLPSKSARFVHGVSKLCFISAFDSRTKYSFWSAYKEDFKARTAKALQGSRKKRWGQVNI